MKDLAPITIIGAGPVGLSCALLLHAQGIATQILDAGRPGAAQTDARVLAVSRGSWRLLQPRLERIHLARAPIQSVQVSSAGEFGQTRITSEHAEPLGATVHYGALVTALTDAVKQAGIALHFETHIDDIQQQSDRVELRHGADTLACPLAILAEGGPSAPTKPSEQWAIVSAVKFDHIDPGLAIERFTREGPLALLPMPSNEPQTNALSLVWCMSQAECERRLGLSDEAFLSELARANGMRNSQPLALDLRHRFALNQHMEPNLRHHRLVRIGNAAQTLHPVAGQGFNLGLRDAAVLAQSLAQHPAEQALRHFAQRRAFDRRAIGSMTKLLPALFASRFTPLALARDAGLIALDWIPALRHRLAHLLMFGVRQAT